MLAVAEALNVTLHYTCQICSVWCERVQDLYALDYKHRHACAQQ